MFSCGLAGLLALAAAPSAEIDKYLPNDPEFVCS